MFGNRSKRGAKREHSKRNGRRRPPARSAKIWKGSKQNGGRVSSEI